MISLPTAILASLLSAFLAARLVALINPPPISLRSRLKPYLHPAVPGFGGTTSGGLVRTVFGPIVSRFADVVGGLLDNLGFGVPLLKLRQAGWYAGMSESEMIAAHRLRQLRNLASIVMIAAALSVMFPLSGLQRGIVLVGGLIVGVTRSKGKVDRRIEERRQSMRIEIYTVDQLLAMRVRSGGGVMQAVRSTVERGEGEVVSELAEAIRLHGAGWRAGDALRRIAELSPEPYCARTYRLLAAADERGADLAASLLALADDVREARREGIKRSATRRRAAMLVPTIAILAPVLILFVAAPLPYLITGWQ